MVIRKGSIYWVDFSPGKGSEPMGRRPGLVIQGNAVNDSKINTVIMLAITSTLKYGDLARQCNLAQRRGEYAETLRHQRFTDKIGRQKQHQGKNRHPGQGKNGGR
jgi:mRNA-degrading endonuclease toxin of MazEF toxin-antitoxin module